MPSSVDGGFENNALASLSNRRLQLIILPTEQCNFRCRYCYEDFSHGKMQPKTIQSIKKLISNRVDSLEELHISWFGGEPLLAKDIVSEISGHASNLCKKKGVKYVSDMTTNGYFLDNKTAQALKHVGVGAYQISLDGVKDDHNSTRVLMSGKGSYEKIWKNLIDLSNSGLDINIILRIHATQNNMANMPAFIEKLERELLNNKMFTAYIKPISFLGKSVDGIDLIPNNDTVDKLNAYIREKGYAKDFPKQYICYACRPDSFVIRVNGKIQKCTVMLANNKNTVGEIQENGSLKIDKMLLIPWIKGIIKTDPKKTRCPAQYIDRPSPDQPSTHT